MSVETDSLRVLDDGRECGECDGWIRPVSSPDDDRVLRCPRCGVVVEILDRRGEL